MKNLNPISGNTMGLFNEIVHGKESLVLKTDLARIRRQIGGVYSEYERLYNLNRLEQLSPDVHCNGQANHFWELYDYSSKSIRNFKKGLEDNQSRSVKYVCQFCTLMPHDTFDHFLPQTEFPEFSVHPLNLLPCCSKCNRKKSAVWREAGHRTILNLYRDKLPNEQYLFVDVFWDTNHEIDFRFFLANSGIVNVALFTLIQEHFYRLGLLMRMREAAVTEFSSMVSSVEKDLGRRDLDELLTDIRRDGEGMRHNYGYNHWKAVLKMALGNSSIFKSNFTTPTV